MPQSGNMLCPDDVPSGGPEYGGESQAERSVTTSFQCEVMLAPHSTSFFLPGGGDGFLANSQILPVGKLDCLKRKAILSLPSFEGLEGWWFILNCLPSSEGQKTCRRLWPSA